MRLIDANALLEKLFNTGYEFGEINVIGTTHVEDAPTVDAAPVVHGEWVSKPHADVIVCSECKEPYFHAKKYTYNYCPNCGAKMDKEEA